MAEVQTVAINADTHDFSVTPKKSEKDLASERRKSEGKFWFAVIALAAAAGGAAYLAFFAAGSATVGDAAREWGRATLSAIVGGVVGYVFTAK